MTKQRNNSRKPRDERYHTAVERNVFNRHKPHLKPVPLGETPSEPVSFELQKHKLGVRAQDGHWDDRIRKMMANIGLKA